MDANDFSQRLTRITTCWSLVFQAHRGEEGRAALARQDLAQRYCAAVYRYLLGAVRDAHAAEDLAQEFALRLVRGDFHRADPGRGRFRDFLKTALYHLVIDYQRGPSNRDRPLTAEVPEPAAQPAGLPTDEAFLADWREELLNQTWQALHDLERQTGQPFYTVLRCRAENPEMRSAAMAVRLGERLGKPLTEAGVRQTLHRARRKFADLLLEEVARTLETRDARRLEEELIDLDLLSYCRDALDRFGRSS